VKLVDILARELKVWPKNVFAITQDDGGSLNGSTAEDPPVWKNNAWGGGAFYLDDPIDSDKCFELDQADDYQSAEVTCAQWQAAVDALKAEKVVEWNGEGLPPVGTVCEICYGSSKWFPAKINYIGPVYVISGEDDGRDEQHYYRKDIQFRPIRTAEQIAADQLDMDAEQLFKVINPSGKWHKLDTELRQRYLAAIMLGYRKFEITKE
jgi:hypothetical protein